MVERANSVVIVPFSICAFDDPYEAFEHETMLSNTGSIHSYATETELHLIVEAGLIDVNWTGTYDDAYELRAAEQYRRGVHMRRDATESERRTALEHFLVNVLLPASGRLALPVVVSWPERIVVEQAPEKDPLETRLESALASWFDEPKAK